MPLLGSGRLTIDGSWVVTKRANKGRIMVISAMLSPKEDTLLLRIDSLLEKLLPFIAGKKCFETFEDNSP